MGKAACIADTPLKGCVSGWSWRCNCRGAGELSLLIPASCGREGWRYSWLVRVGRAVIRGSTADSGHGCCEKVRHCDEERWYEW